MTLRSLSNTDASNLSFFWASERISTKKEEKKKRSAPFSFSYHLRWKSYYSMYVVTNVGKVPCHFLKVWVHPWSKYTQSTALPPKKTLWKLLSYTICFFFLFCSKVTAPYTSLYLFFMCFYLNCFTHKHSLHKLTFIHSF